MLVDKGPAPLRGAGPFGIKFYCTRASVRSLMQETLYDRLLMGLSVYCLALRYQFLDIFIYES
jgi:hypothetical protein